MSSTTRTNLLHYGGAVVLTALAVVLRCSSIPAGRPPSLPHAVRRRRLRRLVGRSRPGVCWRCSSVRSAWPIFILQPRYTFAIDQSEYQVGLVLYGVVGFASIALFESLRKARRRAEEKQRQLEQEVTARRAAEQVLADREELLRITLASIGDAVITTDTEGRVTFLNAVAEALTGWTKDEATGQPLDAVFRIVNEETRQPVENPATQGVAGGRHRRAGEPHRPDRQGRHGAAHRRQCRPDPVQGGPDRRLRAGVPGRDASGGGWRRRMPAACGRSPAGVHRRVVGGRHHQQVAGRHHPKLERRRRAAVRLHRRAGRGASHLPHHPRRPHRRRRSDHRLPEGRAAGRTLRDRAAAERRPARPGFAHHLARPGRGGPGHRGVQDRPGHHRPAAGRGAGAAAAGGSGDGERQVPGVLRPGAAVRRHHGRGRHPPRSQPTWPGGVRLHEGSRSSARSSGSAPGGTARRS